MKINQLDLFSGIGGFHLGFERAGYEVTSFFSEVDKHAIAVYKHQFPNSTYVGSVTDVRGGDLPNIDLITFGSPCQDFSLAGKRLGMEGQRSSLVLEAIRLITECRPRVFVWENVKGTFSSNSGEDFAAILQAFANIGGYRLEWQLLNTSWFLPQNRERIYLVGYSANPSGRGVFPIGEDGSTTASNEIKQIGTKFDSNGGTQPYQQDRVYDADGIVPALNQGKSDLIVLDKRGNQKKGTNASTLVAGYYKLPSDGDYLKVKSATSDGYEQAEVGDSINLSNPNSETRRGRVGKQKAQTLETSCNQAVVENYRIRRLTPIECERLQGFPDQHTAYGNYDGEVKPISNTQRYKQCGNAVTVDVVAAVAKNCLSLFK
jgi:DNA (cytosine-5)-methyltransferase 1